MLEEKIMNDNQFNIGPIDKDISNCELIITEGNSAASSIIGYNFYNDLNSPTCMDVFDYLYNKSFIKHIQFFDIDGRLTHKTIDNDLYTIFNIFKSWYNNQIDLEYKEVYAIEKLYKENPNLLKETILLDISKRTMFANFANIVNNTKITNINHPNYNIRKRLKYD